MPSRLKNLSEFNHKVVNSHLPTIVEFGAHWCGTCQILSTSMRAISLRYVGAIDFYQVDFEQSKDIVAAYGISYLPTYIFFHAGKVVDHFTGALSREAIAQKVERLISNTNSSDQYGYRNN